MAYLISGSVMHCVTLTCMSINAHTGSSSSRHYENIEESVRTRIAQIARNAIQEIDRIAQIVRTNEPSFSSARAERSSSSTSNETPSSSTSAGGSTSSDNWAVKAGSAFLIQSLRCQRPEESVG